ncbi:MAG: SDR family oxidoreductase [Pseudomonadota bacterium]
MNRIVAVTGAAGGMGNAIVRQLLDDGYDVAAIDIDRAGLAELRHTLGTARKRLHVFTADLTDEAAVAAVFEHIAEIPGQLVGLVNNAGTCLMSEFPEIPGDELDQQMAVNFSSAFYCVQQAIPRLLAADGIKKIVNISSNGAYNFDVFDPPHYRASKAAMDTLTKDLARRYATRRIVVNSIAPAMTETPLFEVLDEETLAAAVSAMPSGQPMRPEQIAAWVGFLLSPAGDVASGNVIVLNQGRDVRS